MRAQSSIRIIGGKWRSRKVSFETKEMLRPTPDRIRETLFNWLSPFIIDAVGLDLYAGSGVLGFEALSRGAKSVIAVDLDKDNVLQMEKNKHALDAKTIMIINKNVIDWLKGPPILADLVFVDPPYKLQLLEQTLNLLEEGSWLKQNGFVYFEQNEPYAQESLPRSWTLWREGKAGNVYYYLARKNI